MKQGTEEFYKWWNDQDNGCPTLVLDNDEEFAIAVWNAAMRVAVEQVKSSYQESFKK